MPIDKLWFPPSILSASFFHVDPGCIRLMQLCVENMPRPIFCQKYILPHKAFLYTAIIYIRPASDFHRNEERIAGYFLLLKWAVEVPELEKSLKLRTGNKSQFTTVSNALTPRSQDLKHEVYPLRQPAVEVYQSSFHPQPLLMAFPYGKDHGLK